jgi:hypothetical protein
MFGIAQTGLSGDVPMQERRHTLAGFVLNA